MNNPELKNNKLKETLNEYDDVVLENAWFNVEGICRLLCVGLWEGQLIDILDKYNVLDKYRSVNQKFEEMVRYGTHHIGQGANFPADQIVMLSIEGLDYFYEDIMRVANVGV